MRLWALGVDSEGANSNSLCNCKISTFRDSGYERHDDCHIPRPEMVARPPIDREEAAVEWVSIEHVGDFAAAPRYRF